MNGNDISQLRRELGLKHVPSDAVEFIDPSSDLDLSPFMKHSSSAGVSQTVADFARSYDITLKARGVKRTAMRRAYYLMTVRFSIIRKYLISNADKFDRVIMVDARDVMFQSDPFTQIRDPNGRKISHAPLAA